MAGCGLILFGVGAWSVPAAIATGGVMLIGGAIVGAKAWDSSKRY